MPKFNVLVREVHVSHRSIEAKNAKAALAKATEDLSDTEESLLEYSHTMDPDYWTVEGPFED